MREIKFRIWDNKNKFFRSENAFYCMDGISKCGKYLIMFKDHDSWDSPRASKMSLSDFTVQQYTGIEDENGKEIYEGDIIQYSSWICVVNFGKYELMAIAQNENLQWPFSYVEKECIVIGNIFENPELLKS